MNNNGEFKRKLIQKAFLLAKKSIHLVDNFPSKKSSPVIANQLVRSITSIGANIVEAQSASSKRDFINFLNHTLKSSNESKYWLALSKEINSNDNQEIDLMVQETNELAKILASSIATLKDKRNYKRKNY